MKIKCIDNKENPWFEVGKIYKAWYEGGILCSESEWSTCYHSSLNNGNGVFEMVEEEKSHQHADLILKYAMIAQYDADPWKYFEYETSTGWAPCLSMAAFNKNVNYRLKPQEPKIKVGQIWVDKKGVDVKVRNLSAGIVFTDIEIGGLIIHWSFIKEQFLNNFKIKENKK